MSEMAQQEEKVQSEKPLEVEDQPKVEDEMVSKADLKRALDDLHKYKKEAQMLKETLSQREMNELKEKDEWKKVAEIRESEAKQAMDEADRLKQSIVWEKKYSALRDQALRSGIRKEALEDLELINFDEDVAIETTSSGRINVLGADQAINKLKTLRPHWFSGKSANLNSGGPEMVSGGKVTINDVFKAEKKAKESGDYAPYLQILRKYKEQN